MLKTFVVISLSAIIDIANAQWGAVAPPPQHSCGNKFHWKDGVSDAIQLLPSDHAMQDSTSLIAKDLQRHNTQAGTEDQQIHSEAERLALEEEVFKE